MPGRNYADLARNLRGAGLATETPCAILSRVCTPQQALHRTTILDLSNAPQFEPPSLLIVGDVVGLSDCEADSDSVVNELARKALAAQAERSSLITESESE
jgi:siroheme synthase